MEKNRIELINSGEEISLPAVALRGIVLFPNVTSTFEIARKASIRSLKRAQAEDGILFLSAQKDPSVLEPKGSDLNKTGITAELEHCLKLANGNYQISVRGIARAEMSGAFYDREDGALIALVRQIPETPDSDTLAARKLIREANEVFDEYLNYIKNPAPDVPEQVKSISDRGVLADFLADSFFARFEDRQKVLEKYDKGKRLREVIDIFLRDIDLIELEGSIQTKVKHNIQRGQREIYLREQLKTIQRELNDDGEYDDDDEYREQIEKAKLPEEVKARLTEENSKLLKMPFGSPEASVLKNHIETCLELPWNKKTKDRNNIALAQKILDEDHDGLEKVKSRILEFMAVKQLSPKLNGQIICLVGPPGVGKTSIAKSIARATNRKYARISLGGIRDEAEIRGHRKTYIGAMPGRIINALKIAKSFNPVMLLDEIDKLTADAHGDPTSALLEVLDSEQNKQFRDHFIEIPVDLSDCLFIATANTDETIPAPLIDRMEMIYMDSYSDKEKLSIAKNHLIPKQIKLHGLTKRNLVIEDEAIKRIIESYTHESGVRGLERQIAAICRKTAKSIISDGVKKVIVNSDKVKELLGPEKIIPEKIYDKDNVGVVNGLAWTQVGGVLLRIEAVSMKGTGKTELTGHLGNVMKESAGAAISFIRKHAEEFGVDPDFYANRDIHIHIPEGAIPKDGPSAGTAITTALISELSGRPVKRDVAMTGEITLTGRVLQIGGLKEKSAAAFKAGVKTVIVPKDNLPDIDEFDDDVKNGINFVGVSDYSEVFALAFADKEEK